MNAVERRAVSGLGAIFALRLMGLFLILPVFAVYAPALQGYTPELAGFALGVYGLTQGLLQIAYGVASDRFGRKRVIALGLIVFVAGSVVAALSTSIYGVILGRALQGAGAVAAAVIALIADQTREEQRTKAMAVVGMIVGGSFVLSLLLGPVLTGLIGVPGIFWLTALLAASGLAVLVWWVPPAPPRAAVHAALPHVPQFVALLRDPQLLRLDLGIFFLHCALTALFVVVPLALVHQAGLAVAGHWKVYLPVMVASAAVMFPLLLMAERKQRVREMFILAVAVLVVSQLVFYAGHESLAGLIAGLFVFFVAFNILEAQLPSLISRVAPARTKGMAIGVYSTFEFLGAFVGGAAGGLLHRHFGIPGVFLFGAGVLALWLAFAVTMPRIGHVVRETLRVGRRHPEEASRLAEEFAAVRGVVEATVVAEEGLAHLKLDRHRLDRHALDELRRRNATS
jgi:MFS family permease